MNEKLLLQDLVVLLAKKSKTTQKKADKFWREFFQLILECIYENDIVKIKDFGTFKLIKISSRESVDVNTGEKIEIPSHYKMSFTPDKLLKNLVNEPFAHFESVILEEGIDFETTKEKVNKEKPWKGFDDFSLDDDLDIDLDDNENEIVSEIKVPEKKFIAEPILEEDDEDELLLSDKIEEDIEEIKTVEVKKTEIKHKEESVPVQKPVIEKTRSYIEDDPIIEKSLDITGKRGNTVRRVMKDDTLESDISLDFVPKKENVVKKIPLLDILDIDDMPRRSIPGTVPDESKIDRKPHRAETTPVPVVREERKSIDKKESVAPAKKENNRLNTFTEELEGFEDVFPVSQEKLSVKDNNKGAVPFNTLTNNTASIDEIEEENPDNYQFVDYERLEKNAKWKRRTPWIIIGIFAAFFAVYQFAKLFDVTYDYEYFINHVPALTVSDSMLMIDQVPTYSAPLSTKNDTDDVAEGADNTSAAGTINKVTNEVVESNFDALNTQMRRESSISIEGIDISDLLNIRVVNKAQLYLQEK